MIPVVKKAVAAGIPVVAFNPGIDDYTEAGAMMYFGSDETLAGQTVGKRIAEEGGGKTLCVIQAQGSVALEARCAGVKEALREHGEPPGQRRRPAVGAVRRSQAKLQQDKSITYIVTLGAPIALAALAGRAATRAARPRSITFDLNQDAAQAIKDGKIEFSVDQQPYLQGYMAVDALWLYLTNGNDIGGGKPVLTGPSFVDKTNIDQILPYTQNNTR